MITSGIHVGDCLDLLRAQEAFVDLVFADPPYNIGYVYDRYEDDKPDDEYVRWSEKWMEACCKVLNPRGSMYVAIGDEFAADLRLIGRKLGLTLRNWIVWHYTFGQNMQTKFCRSHAHILYFVKDPGKFTFNSALVRYPGARHTRYQDNRASDDGRVHDDVWSDIPRVCGTHKERDGSIGCQLPEALLMRIIMASSNEGDVVLDPFVGSGTTAVVAKKLGRVPVGIDISEEYCARAKARLDNTQLRLGLPAEPCPFHWEVLIQLYRETCVSAPDLVANEAAMKVLVKAFNLRAKTSYTVNALTEMVETMAREGSLPPLPNDRPFVEKTSQKDPKPYKRPVKRWTGRKTR